MDSAPDATEPPSGSHDASSRGRAVGTWVLVLATGLILLIGRFDWSGADDHLARRGYVLSAYLFVLTLPLLFYLVRHLFPRPVVARVATSVGFVVLTLPYQWFGLDTLYYYRNRGKQWFDESEIPPIETRFLPEGPWSTFPHDVLLFGLLLVAGALLVAWLWRRGTLDSSRRKQALLVFGLFAAILLQTFLHSGVRSPYAYVTHLKPERAPEWYALAHWSDGTGVVNEDQGVFSAIETAFHGEKSPSPNMFMRRPYGFYVAAQFNYFVNTYYVWIVINVLMWLAAAVATYHFTRRIATQQAARLAAALTATGSGFVLFVGTSAMYLQAYALVIISLLLFERLVVSSREEHRWRDLALFGAFLAATSLTYDFIIVYVTLFLYGLVRKVRFRDVSIVIGGAFVVYTGFLAVHDHALGLTISDANSEQISLAVEEVLDVARSPSLTEIYAHVTDIVGGYALSLGRMFLVIPLVPAVIGIRYLRTRAQMVIVIALFGATLALLAAFRISADVQPFSLGSLPRFLYPAYPAVYLLAALALARLSRIPASTRFAPYLRAAPWVFVAAVFVVSNIDAFGHQSLYYEAVYGRPLEVAP